MVLNPMRDTTRIAADSTVHQRAPGAAILHECSTNKKLCRKITFRLTTRSLESMNAGRPTQQE